MKICKSYLEWVAILGEVFSQNVQHPNHLREDQNSVASFSESSQQLVQQHQLPTAPYKTLKCTQINKYIQEKYRNIMFSSLKSRCAEHRYPEVLLAAEEGS